MGKSSVATGDNNHNRLPTEAAPPVSKLKGLAYDRAYECRVVACRCGRTNGLLGEAAGHHSAHHREGQIDRERQAFAFDPTTTLKLPPGTKAPPVAPGSIGMIQISFHGAEGTDLTYGKMDATLGTFEVTNIKPGRYKIAITVGSLPPNASDPLGGKFTPEKTKILRELKEGEEIVIDIAKPTG